MLSVTIRENTFRVEIVKLAVPGIKMPVALRLDTSDMAVFEQIFVNREYEFHVPASPRFIVDGGANVGLASIWFANRYPAAKIVAVEPYVENIRLLRENTSDYPNIEVLQAAIWHQDGDLQTVTHDGSGRFLGHWGVQVMEAQAATENRIPAVTVDRILSESKQEVIDILKLDVEGAEKEIFSANCQAWLAKTNVVVIELHDRFKPGCSHSVFSALAGLDFQHSRNAEFDVFIRNSML